ncbi:hypothetical protein CAPTEDRAFT_193870 [Capitella teleta]|uniref:Uncharacterized protein n=1 Tax=Capitella teleta TaxID=283909 RepID=R7UYP9_CAPTE|nr:hypothetical protein CAPTEDRAFT_193870 [Capitella teleta]|eukprot:ELU11464.1 hypothetical protein CAPTEDRAFT_193870 [Capitella teleta]
MRRLLALGLLFILAVSFLGGVRAPDSKEEEAPETSIATSGHASQTTRSTQIATDPLPVSTPATQDANTHLVIKETTIDARDPSQTTPIPSTNQEEQLNSTESHTPASEVEDYATDNVTKANFTLSWETWNPWTSCYASQRSAEYERMRMKLCSVSEVSKERDLNESCPYSLIAKIEEREIDLRYDVQVEECTPDLDGVWVNWTTWSTCSASCDKGTTSRQRICVGQSGQGRECEGQATQYDFCERAQCPSGATSVSSRREELLPTMTFTESDSYTSNICVSSTAIVITLLPFTIFLVLDVVSLCRCITLANKGLKA